MLFLRERPGARLVAAIALATVGVLAVAGSSGADAKPTRIAGIALVLAATACEAVFILGQKRLRTPIEPLAMSTLMCLGGLLLALPVGLLRLGSAPSHWTLPAVGGILYYAWVPTVLGFLLWYAGARRTSGTRAALATAWLPVTALLLSAAALGEPVTWAQGLGLVCVVAAMALAATSATADAVKSQAETASRGTTGSGSSRASSAPNAST